MVPDGVPTELAAHAHELLISRRAAELSPFLEDWPTTATGSARQEPPPQPAGLTSAPATLPVLRWITELPVDPDAAVARLTTSFRRHARALLWRQSYGADVMDGDFLHNYGWTELIGPHAPIMSARVACGVLLLGPATFYPPHRHEAEEIYVPLCGHAHWRQGDEVWRERMPGELIRHASNEPHAMRTGNDPLLALYVWRGGDLHQKAQLHS